MDSGLVNNAAWKRIKRTVVGVLEEHRADRLFKERATLLTIRLSALWKARRRLSQFVSGDVNEI